MEVKKLKRAFSPKEYLTKLTDLYKKTNRYNGCSQLSALR